MKIEKEEEEEGKKIRKKVDMNEKERICNAKQYFSLTLFSTRFDPFLIYQVHEA